MRNFFVFSLLVALALNLLFFPYTEREKLKELNQFCDTGPIIECLGRQFEESRREPAWSMTTSLMDVEKNFPIFFIQLLITIGWFSVLSIGLYALPNKENKD